MSMLNKNIDLSSAFARYLLLAFGFKCKNEEIATDQTRGSAVAVMADRTAAQAAVRSAKN